MNLRPFALTIALALPLTLAAQAHSWGSSSAAATSGPAFLHKLAQEDHSEIHLAHLALTKSKNPRVRAYAKSKILAADPDMAKDARKVQRASQPNQAGAAGVANRAAVSQERAKDRAEYKKLSRLSGAQFDRAYMQYEARKQGADLTLVRQEASSASNAKIRSFAQRQEAPVKKAADSARSISSTLGTSPAK